METWSAWSKRKLLSSEDVTPGSAGSAWVRVAKLIFALFLVVYGIFLATSPETYRFLDRVDLVFHEAGHWIFLAFGSTLTVLGGTLMQLLIPILLAGYFLLRRSFYSASVVLFWLGQSFFNVSVYARDARAMALPCWVVAAMIGIGCSRKQVSWRKTRLSPTLSSAWDWLF